MIHRRYAKAALVALLLVGALSCTESPPSEGPAVIPNENHDGQCPPDALVLEDLVASLEASSPHPLVVDAERTLEQTLTERELTYLARVDWTSLEPEQIVQDPVMLEAARALEDDVRAYTLHATASDCNSITRSSALCGDECQAAADWMKVGVAVVATAAVCVGGGPVGCGIILAIWMTSDSQASEVPPGEHARPDLYNDPQGGSCGTAGQACCEGSGAPCEGMDLACDDETGTCEICGGPEAPCCPMETCSYPELTCAQTESRGARCLPCGEEGAPCCQDDPECRPDGAICDRATNTCVDPCADLTCDGFVCAVQPDGCYGVRGLHPTPQPDGSCDCRPAFGTIPCAPPPGENNPCRLCENGKCL